MRWSRNRSASEYRSIASRVGKLPKETEWVEFKHNNDDPYEIGEYISALANSATLHEKNSAYLIWGIDDKTHEIVGTTFDFRKAKAKGTELDTWVRLLLSDFANFRSYSDTVDGNDVVVLEIDPAQVATIQFQNISYIRVGSYKKKLKDFPAIEAELWRKLNASRYEEMVASPDLSAREALKLLDYVSYFDLLGIEQPEAQDQIIHYLEEDGLLQRQDNGLYAISNTGALLFGKKLSSFDRIGRKMLRIVQYSGDGRAEGVREESIDKGYISGFEEAIRLIESMLPSREKIGEAFRETITAYPDVALRELTANILIHQDLAETGSGPMIELFDGRIEFSNPGAPLVDTRRFIDNPPKSRNEKVAALFRRADLCEERGSGWDKIELECFNSHLPSPKITAYDSATRVTISAHKPYKDLSPEERLWTCYVHSYYQQTLGKHTTNESLRERLDIAPENKSMVSRLIKGAVEREIIKPFDQSAAKKSMSYVPFWV